MDLYADIIKTPVVHEQWDAYWDDAPMLNDMAHKPVLVITNKYENGSKEEMQLNKMLQACALLPEKYNLIQLDSEQHIAWHKLSDKLQPKIIFLIGIRPAQLGISALFKINEPNSFDDCVWLATLSINELEQYPDAKKQLWVNGIKPVFNPPTPAKG